MTRTGARRVVLGGRREPKVDFDLDALTFTPAMDKRVAPGPFDRAPIVQGRWDGAGTSDVVTFLRGDLLANQTDAFRANIDIQQGSIVLWWTPEKDRDVAQTLDEYLLDISATVYLRYEHDNAVLRFR